MLSNYFYRVGKDDAEHILRFGIRTGGQVILIVSLVHSFKIQH